MNGKLIRKIILLAMLAIAFVFVSAGCNGPKSDSGDSNETYNIVWYNMATPTKDHDLVFEEVSKNTLEKINATVTCIPIRTSEYAEKMRMLISAGEDFDMCFTSRDTDYTTHVSGGAYLPVDDLLESHGKDIIKLLPEYVFDGARVGGKLYAVPVLKDWAHESVIRYNVSLAEKYNLDMQSVKKLEDLEPALQKIKDNEPEIMPLLNRGNSSLFRMLPFEAISGSAVGAFRLDDYTKIINQYDTDEAKEYYKLMRRWYQKGFVRRDAAIVTNDNEYYTAGNFFANYAESLPYLELELNMAPKDGQKRNFIYGMTQPLLFTKDIQGSMQAISRTSKNPKKTMEFMNLLYTDRELKNLITLGIPGKHYIPVGEDYYKYPEGVKNASETGYAPAVDFCVGNRYLSRLIEGVPSDKWEKYQEFNDKAFKSEAMGFVFDAKDVTAEVAAINNVYQEFMPLLLVGSVDPDEYLPKAMEKFRIAGLDTVLAEMQNQYDQWRESRK